MRVQEQKSSLGRGLGDHPKAMALLCSALRARGKTREAVSVAMAAVAAAPDDMEVRDLVALALTSGVPKWHIPMLRDGARNRAYALALERAVRPGMTVLEIGTGGGLLSMIAARAGARVFTCEANPVVAAAAGEIFARNGFTTEITLVPKLSWELELGRDIPERADLLVSELFDDTLFADSIVRAIADAKQRLLTPDAPVIPRYAELRCALLNFGYPEKHRPLDLVEGFDMSPLNVLAHRPSSFLRVAKLNSQQRSASVAALPLDFHSLAPFGPLNSTVRFASVGGRIDGVAQWLRIGFGEDLWFENNPFAGPPSHWGSPVYPFCLPLDTAQDEALEVKVSRIEDQLLIGQIRRVPSGGAVQLDAR